MQDRAQGWLTRYPRALPALVFLAVVIMTGIAVMRTEMAEYERVRAEAGVNAKVLDNALERRAQSFASLLEASKILFSAMGPIEPTRFRILVGEVARDMELRGARSFGWIAVADEGGGDTPTARITHIAPSRPEIKEWLGTDIYALPDYAPVLREAARTNVPTATGMTRAISDAPGGGVGLTMVLPVYAERTQGDLVQGDLTGYFFCGFEAQQFLDEAIAPLDRSHLRIRLYDRAIDDANLLARSGPQIEGALRSERVVKIGNRDMVLVVETPYERSLTQGSIGLLLFGLTFACLLMLVTQWLASSAASDQRRLAFLEEQHSIRNSLSRELNHRVRNTLASVLSILSLTRRRAHDLDQFADSLEGRIRALSTTHDLLAETDWGTVPIRAVIAAELAPMADAQGVVIEGPEVDLAPGDALSFGLALHELATNAAKFGALSVPEGRVEVRWHMAQAGDPPSHLAIVEWTESGGPPVAPTRPRGFGSELIERLVPAQLKHEVELEFRPEGVRCRFGVPVRRLGEFQLRETHS